MKRNIFILLFFFLIGAITFVNGLKNEFCIDDHAFFDEKMRNIKFIGYQFIPDKNVALKIRDQQTDAYYRPMAHVIPMLAYLSFGNNVVGHHALNAVLFVLAAFMFFIFLKYVFKDERLAFIAALLYLVHPINGVAVNYITANVFSAQIIFMLLSLLILLGRTPIFCIPFFILAVMCHETAMGLPFYATALVVALGARGKDIWRRTYVIWIAFVLYFIFRMKFASLGSSILGNFVKYQMSVWEYGASMAKLIVWYLAKLVYPVNIILIKALPVVREQVLVWFIVLLILGAGALALVWMYRRSRVALFGLLWFLIGFIPFTQACLFRPSHGLMVEPHWFIFPVIGFFIFVAHIFVGLSQRFYKLTCGIFLAVVCSWMFMSIQMNAIWSNEINYCKYWLKESPGFSSVMFYLAKAYELKKDYVSARHWYEQALMRNFQPYGVYTNLGLLDIMEGKLEDANVHLKKGLDLNYMMPIAISNLGTIAFMQNDYASAKGYFTKSIELDRFNALPRLNLGRTLVKLGKYDEAEKVYLQILDIVPNYETALTALFKMYLEIKDTKKIVWAAERLAASAFNPEAVVNAGIVLEGAKLFPQALSAYRRATILAPAYNKARILYERLQSK